MILGLWKIYFYTVFIINLQIQRETLQKADDGKFYIEPIFKLAFLPPVKLYNFLPVSINVFLKVSITSNHQYT